MGNLSEHVDIQAIAKRVLFDLVDSIKATDTERIIADRAVSLLAGHGITETWYYDCPAFVLLGSRSCLSVSGRSYIPSDEPVGLFNLVTVDISPLRSGVWGDCARSFPVEEGRCTLTPLVPELAHGMQVESALHRAMQAFVTPSTTFQELFDFGNTEIRRCGFENLDFLGNLGHSIVSKREDRRYIEPGNSMQLGSVPFFTFEPHIRQIAGMWGFKYEEIYFFDSQELLRTL